MSSGDELSGPSAEATVEPSAMESAMEQLWQPSPRSRPGPAPAGSGSTAEVSVAPEFEIAPTPASAGRTPQPNVTTAYSETDHSAFPLRRLGAGRAPAIGLDRYTFIDLIARGGQGEVWKMHDKTLGRYLAVKILRPKVSRRARARLELEIDLTVSLSHPGIIPVYDKGIATDGRPWFAMKQVDGEHLGNVISSVHNRNRRWNLRRLIDLLVRICEAVAYAHKNGVLHRDLKPRNIMVGQFGEVLVMDWGLARRLPDRPTPLGRKPRSPAGTAGYIAPELYDDPRILDPRVDVYGLGAVLFTMLSGRRPPTTPRVVPQAEDIGLRWADGTEMPAELISLCLRSMAADPIARISSADSMSRALVAWLDGERKREEALEMVAEARAMVALMERERNEIARLNREADEALENVPPWADTDRKAAGWTLQDKARRLLDRLVEREVRFEQKLGAALNRAPNLPDAMDLLADHYRGRLLAAESRRDDVAARRAESMLRGYDRGRYSQWLAGHGRLTVLTDPPEAHVVMHPFQLENRRLVPGAGIDLGRTPIVDLDVPRGSYLLILDAPGRAAVRYPVYIERGASWSGHAPGDATPRLIRLPFEDELGPDHVYVPAGWTVLGGDDKAVAPMERSRLWVDGFVIQRLPVTWRAWLEFIVDLDRRGEAEWLERCLPRHPNGALLMHRDPAGEWRCVDSIAGFDLPLDSPICFVSWHAATAYAGWVSRSTGVEWRLPHALEWEKAARGADGRFMPWGDYFDPSWARVLDSYDGPAESAPEVGSAPGDTSPYGVCDMAGMVRNWCGSSFERHPPADRRVRLTPPEGSSRDVRGGAWVSKMTFCRPAGRFVSNVDIGYRTIGVRLCRSFDVGVG